MRGEYQNPYGSSHSALGSPPHAWRILAGGEKINDSIGITSTCVENTLFFLFVSLPPEDHLHMRGEYDELSIGFAIILGSPPHAWRIQKGPKELSWQYRITSTCVENTQSYNLVTMIL